MEGFAVTCPLAPDAPRLISGFCSSSRSFGLDFHQTPPHDDALALLLAFGSAKTWQSDFHRLSNAPCPAHTSELRGADRRPHQWVMRAFAKREDHAAREKPPTRQSDALPVESTRSMESG